MPNGGGAAYSICDPESLFYVTEFPPHKVSNILAELYEKRLIVPVQSVSSDTVFRHQIGFVLFTHSRLYEYWVARYEAKRRGQAEWWHTSPRRYRFVYPFSGFRRRLTYRLGWYKSKALPQTVSIIFLPQPEDEPVLKPRLISPSTVQKAGVYLVKSVTGHYKIGRTSDIYNRIRTFEVKLPFEIELEHFIPTTQHHELERRLHRRFAAKHVNGEWFALTSEDVETIKRINAANFRRFIR